METLEDALVQQRRLGHLPMVAITSADLAETLARRGADGDAARADCLLDGAIERGTAMGLDARVAVWHARRDLAPALGTAVHRGVCWEFATGRETATIPDSTGARYLVTLLSHPGTDLAAVALAGAIAGSSSQPVIDDRARHEYQGRIGEIERRLDAADREGDCGRSAQLRADMDALLAEVARAVRPDGRTRVFVDSAERARTSVQKALRRALKSVATASPDLADQLSRSIRTGTTCRFDPAPGVPARWDVS